MKSQPNRSLRITTVALLMCFSILGNPQAVKDSQLIARTYVDSTGSVHIINAKGKDRAIAKEKNQVEVGKILISEDKKSAGWVVTYENCCTSYSIPLLLVIYRDGKVQRLNKGGLMIYDWRFSGGGTQVAFCTGTVHGSWNGHCELHDVKNGHQLASIDGPLDESSPVWARDLHN